MKYKAIDGKIRKVTDRQMYTQQLIDIKNKAYKYRRNNIDITKEQANILNNKLSEVSVKLEPYGYDIENDEYIDFLNYVKDSKFYHNFMW